MTVTGEALQEAVETSAQRSDSRILRATSNAAKTLLKGLFWGAGFMIPVSAGGVYVINHAQETFEETVKQQGNELISRGGEELSRRGDEFGAQEIGRLEGPLTTLVEVFPRPPEPTTTTTIVRQPVDELGMALGIDPSATTTTLPPQE